MTILSLIRGDSVTVKLANIDKATYDFWRTMEYNYQSIGNPFSSPTVVMSNISNDALGYFGGYAAQYNLCEDSEVIVVRTTFYFNIYD